MAWSDETGIARHKCLVLLLLATGMSSISAGQGAVVEVDQKINGAVSNGLVAAAKGDYRQACDLFDEARQGLGTNSPAPLRFTVLNNLGMCRAAMERRVLAYRAYCEALVAIRESDDVEHLLAVTANLGALCVRMGKTEEALQYCKLVSAICERTGKTIPVETLSNQGMAESILGRHADAEASLRRALQMVGRNSLTVRCRLTANLAADLTTQGRLADAISLLKEAQAASTNRTAGTLLLRVRLAYLYARSQQSELARSQLAGLDSLVDQQDLSLSIRLTVLAANAELARQAKEYDKEARIREDMITVLKEAGGVGGDVDLFFEQGNAWRYLDVADAWRNAGNIAAAMKWLEVGRQAEERQVASASVALLEDPQLVATIEDCLALSRKPAEREEGQEVAGAALDREKRFEEAKNELRRKSPDYWQVLFADRLNVHPDEMNQISYVLPHGVAFLEPVVFRDQIALFICTKGEAPECITVPLEKKDGVSGEESVRRLVAKVRLLLSRPSPPSQTKKACSDLYDLVLRPVERVLVERGTRILLVSPAGYLRYVPFASLYDGKQYLVESFAIANVTGLDLIRLASQEVQLAGRPSFLAFADPDGTLPGALAECHSIAQIFPGAKVLHGAEATRERFLASSGDTTLLHLATHGVLDSNDPASSHLVFAGGRNLTYSGMLGLPCLTNLRVLTMSACDTASDSLGDGFEMAGMAYQFIRKTTAGSVVASQWKVDDAATAKLMLAFYRNMDRATVETGALRRAESLATAQRALLASDDGGHPFFWGGFVLIGDYR